MIQSTSHEGSLGKGKSDAEYDSNGGTPGGDGWAGNGKTRFKLANGQVWQQVGTGEFVHHAVNPTVDIKPKSMGSWKLYVEGINRGVKVKRIK